MSSIGISIGTLRRACEIILSQLDRAGNDQLWLPYDYYWEVLFDESFNMETKPDKLAVGSLSDDIDAIHRVLSDSSEVFISDLVPLAAVLRGLAATLLAQKSPDTTE